MEQITVYVPVERVTEYKLNYKEGNVLLHPNLSQNLEERQGYFFTPEELEEVIGKAFDAGYGRSQYDSDRYYAEFPHNKEGYVKTVLKSV